MIKFLNILSTTFLLGGSSSTVISNLKTIKSNTSDEKIDLTNIKLSLNIADNFKTVIAKEILDQSKSSMSLNDIISNLNIKYDYNDNNGYDFANPNMTYTVTGNSTYFTGSTSVKTSNKVDKLNLRIMDNSNNTAESYIDSSDPDTSTWQNDWFGNYVYSNVYDYINKWLGRVIGLSPDYVKNDGVAILIFPKNSSQPLPPDTSIDSPDYNYKIAIAGGTTSKYFNGFTIINNW